LPDEPVFQVADTDLLGLEMPDSHYTDTCLLFLIVVILFATFGAYYKSSEIQNRCYKTHFTIDNFIIRLLSTKYFMKIIVFWAGDAM
jgi:hypothetical protein